MKSSFGSVLSEWRAARRLSQLGLALLTGVSQRHISFVESGRAQPSRDTIFKLADGLDLSLRARNDLFLAAGYAPAYAERRLELAEMMAAREALEMILRHHEPYPAVVMDAGWNIVMQNAAASRIIAHCVGTDALRQLFPKGIVNFMQLMFSENGLRPHIRNWTHTRLALLKRLRREAAANPASPSEALRRGFGSEEQTAGEAVINDESLDPMLSLELRVGDSLLRLFNTFTTFGTPQDVSLQELRIDMSFPADEATRRFLDAESRARRVSARTRDPSRCGSSEVRINLQSRAFSSEVETGSREENASKQKSRARF
jgi:transcriptional regulator with XRE-family HTH domain